MAQYTGATAVYGTWCLVKVMVQDAIHGAWYGT